MDEALGRTIVVPVANPASAPALLACAARLAARDQGRLVPITVLPSTATEAARDDARAGLAVAEEAAHELGLHAQGALIEDDDVAGGVLGAIRDVEATLVLMGWRGRSSTHNVFGALIDSVVGRSSVPLAVVRLGPTPFRRVLLPVSADHLLPGGDRGLGLAVAIGGRLAEGASEPTTVLRTGPREARLPPEVARLSDRLHHDPRRADQAVGAFAGPDDVIVAAVAPTVSGLRAATTHLAWSAPEATLLVGDDVGPPHEEGLADAVDHTGRAAPRGPSTSHRSVPIMVTARLPDEAIGDAAVTPNDLDHVLATVGATDHLMAWWPMGDTRPHVCVTVTVPAATVNAAIAAVTVAVSAAPAFRGAEITYELDRGAPEDVVGLAAGELAVLHVATDDALARGRP